MRAIILLSGGLDSTVILAKALSEGRECYALSFDYGQRHRWELRAAQQIAAYYKVPHHIIKVDPSTFANSSLVSMMQVPKGRSLQEMNDAGIPNTYVPARNTLFLAYALGQAEILKAQEIYIGVNALDNNYPDCCPAFIKAFQALICVATKQSLEVLPPTLLTPLISLTKQEIVKLGRSLAAPLELSFSCYDPSSEGEACFQCDACILRQLGFK